MEKFEVRKYFDTFLEKRWIFDTEEEADKFYRTMDDERNSPLVQYEIRKVVDNKNVEV